MTRPLSPGLLQGGLFEQIPPPAEVILKEEPGTLVWKQASTEGEPLVLKMYRQRGVVTFLRWHLWGSRTEREYNRLRHLTAAGVLCTEAVDWSWGRSAAHGCFEVLVMRDVEGAIALDEFLKSKPLAPGPLDRLFRELRSMHESGLCNQTLFSANIIVSQPEAAEPTFLLSDVPRSWVFPRSLVGTNLAYWDLLDFTRKLLRDGLSSEQIPLAEYGLSGAESDTLLSDLKTFADGKISRRRRDAQVRVRLMLARIPLIGRYLAGI